MLTAGALVTLQTLLLVAVPQEPTAIRLHQPCRCEFLRVNHLAGLRKHAAPGQGPAGRRTRQHALSHPHTGVAGGYASGAEEEVRRTEGHRVQDRGGARAVPQDGVAERRRHS